MKKVAYNREAIAAAQIKAALVERGLSKKKFAELMGKGPSEVTKWLSGEHNFTIALLQRISDVLGTEITGVEEIWTFVEDLDAQGNMKVEGNKCILREPAAAVYGNKSDLYYKIRRRSSELGMSAKEYIEKLVDKDIEDAGAFPQVTLPLLHNDIVEKFAGIIKVKPSPSELENDERLSRIWNR